MIVRILKLAIETLFPDEFYNPSYLSRALIVLDNKLSSGRIFPETNLLANRNTPRPNFLRALSIGSFQM